MSKLNELSSIELVIKPSEARLDEVFNVLIKFSLKGEIRERFNAGNWVRAYNSGDRKIRLKFEIELLKKAGLVKKKLIEPIRLVRKASLYISKNPYSPYKVLPLIILEDRRVEIPNDEEDAKSLLFDLKRNLQILASSLGKGEHKVFARVKVKWGRYSFIEKGEVKKESSFVVIKCI
jgi:hypothetical protein